MRRFPVPHVIVLALPLASALACSRSSGAAADTESVECSHLRCDNPNPSNCACPDDTDGVITNTPTESHTGPETSGSSTTADATTTSTTSTTSTASTTSTSTGSESTSSSSTGAAETSTGTGSESGSTGTDTGTESGSSGPMG
jgi:hypothetical protein